MTVLVLTCAEDDTADGVVSELHKRGTPVVRIDPGDVPMTASSTTRIDTAWRSVIATSDTTVDLGEVSAVWWRRPTEFRLPEGMSSAEQTFAMLETRLGFGGVLASMDCLWVNHPHTIARVEYKPVQLRAALTAGLPIPATAISNDPAAVREFAQEHPSFVCKPFSPISFTSPDDVLISPYTAKLTVDDLNDEQIAVTMNLFQEWVPKTYEARVTVIGREVFAVAIHAASEAARIDWRRDFEALSYEQIDTPAEIRDGITAFMDALGLNFGAFDFVVRPDGRWVFLECNPNGQWGWLEYETGVPITNALAHLLMKGSI